MSGSGEELGGIISGGKYWLSGPIGTEKQNFSNRSFFKPIVVWRALKGYLENSADPDQTPQNAASDQGIHCLQIV